jgi:hypothetical protein
MDKSLDGISAPLLFLQDKDPTSSKKKKSTGKDPDAWKFLMQQKRKRDRGNACALLLASNSQIAKEYAEIGAVKEADNLLHCVCEMDEEDEWMIPSSAWNSASPGELSPLDWKNAMRTSNSYLRGTRSAHVGDPAKKDRRQNVPGILSPRHRWRRSHDQGWPHLQQVL